MDRKKLSNSQKYMLSQMICGPLKERNRGDNIVYEFSGKHFYIRVFYELEDFDKSIYISEYKDCLDLGAPALERAKRTITLVICHKKQSTKCGPFHWFISGPFIYCTNHLQNVINKITRLDEDFNTKQINVSTDSKKYPSDYKDAKEYLNHYGAEKLTYSLNTNSFSFKSEEKIGNSKIVHN